MNDIPLQQLTYIITNYGRSVADDPRRCEALLRDLCPEHKREVNVLVSALKQGIPHDLLSMNPSMPAELTFSRLRKRLYDDLGMAEDFAHWAVETWGLALGMVKQRTVPAVSAKAAPVNPRTAQKTAPPPLKNRPFSPSNMGKKEGASVKQFIQLEDLLMVKFYVVDGLSYPACEAAIGLFDHLGFEAMKHCREIGYIDKNAKGSETLISFQNTLQVKQIYPAPPASFSDLAVDPLNYFLAHKGFGVRATSTEMGMAHAYLVEGNSYLSAEKQFQIKGQKGFAAMHSVCKLGGFRGRKDRGTMTEDTFSQRLRLINLM